ncbi:MAG: CPBP family intramembrane glutamic endopeptidase [Planctomycetota bacterium]|jgi:membrane protease YdiL (CAAX protease family)
MNDPQPRTSRRADAFAAAFTLVLPAVLACVYFVWLAKSPAPLQQATYAIGKTVQFAFPVFWVLVICRRRPAWRPPDAAGIVEGLAFGAAVAVGMVVLYHAWLGPAGYLEVAQKPIVQKLQGFGLEGPVRYVLFAAFLSVVHSLLEEYYWRWFVFGQLRRLVPVPAAILISAVGFTAHHVIVLATYFGWASPATWLFSLAVAAGGVAWAWIYHRSGSLWGPWLSHLLVDAAVFVVGYDLIRHVFQS